MVWTGCEEIVLWFMTKQSGDPAFRTDLLRILATEPPDLGAVASLAADEPAVAVLLAKELDELPATVTRSILRSWRDAAELGVAFRLISAKPSEPLQFARRRLVRVVTEVSDAGVTTTLMHIPRHHPNFKTSVGRPQPEITESPLAANSVIAAVSTPRHYEDARVAAQPQFLAQTIRGSNQDVADTTMVVSHVIVTTRRVDNRKERGLIDASP